MNLPKPNYNFQFNIRYAMYGATALIVFAGVAATTYIILGRSKLFPGLQGAGQH